MEPDITWINLEEIGVEGRGWTNLESPYDRFPIDAKEKLESFNPALWDLSHSSTGMCVTFRTDSTSIMVRREFFYPALEEHNFNACAFSGFDLYGETPQGKWRWIGTMPHGDTDKTEYYLAKDMAPGYRRYRVYLPLRNKLLKGEIGILNGSRFEAEAPRPAAQNVVFYGSSIVHGAYVSHGGLSHPSRLGRTLDFPIINLGFSGSAKMEIGTAEILAELECQLYVIDALPNMTPDLVRQNALPFLRRLRELRPDTPFLLMEEPDRTHDWVFPQLNKRTRGNRAELKKAYRQFLAEGETNTTYLKGYGLTGTDGEHSIDGIHPCDTAVERMYKKMLPVIRNILKK